MIVSARLSAAVVPPVMRWVREGCASFTSAGFFPSGAVACSTAFAVSWIFSESKQRVEVTPYGDERR